MKTVTAFRTTDGELFEEEHRAQQHEVWLQKKEMFEAFLNSESNHYKSVSQRSIVKLSLINWEFWKIKNAIE